MPGDGMLTLISVGGAGGPGFTEAAGPVGVVVPGVRSTRPLPGALPPRAPVPLLPELDGAGVAQATASKVSTSALASEWEPSRRMTPATEAPAALAERLKAVVTSERSARPALPRPRARHGVAMTA